MRTALLAGKPLEEDRRNDREGQKKGESIKKIKSKKESGKFKIKNLKSFLELVRFEHGFLFSIGAIVGVALAGGNILTLNVLLGVLAIICVEMGTFAMNDYFDYPADKANRRMDRPLVRGDVTLDVAALTALITLPLGNILAALLTADAFYLVVVLSVLSIAYNLLLKKFPLIGNVFIGITMAAPFVFGSLLTEAIAQPAVFLAAIAFIVGVGREIMKDAEDIKGDVKTGGKTLPVMIGLKSTAYAVTFCYLIGIVLSIMPFFTFFKGKPQYLIILLTDLLLLAVAFKLLKSQGLKTLRQGRKWTLYAIAIGLLAFLLAAVF